MQEQIEVQDDFPEAALDAGNPSSEADPEAFIDDLLGSLTVTEIEILKRRLENIPSAEGVRSPTQMPLPTAGALT